MKPGPFVALLFVSWSLCSCAPRKSKEELARLDMSSAENFIQSVIDNRKDTYSDSGSFDIEGKEAFANGEFHIVNFTERISDRKYAYAILLGQDEPIGSDSTGRSVYADVQRLMNRQAGKPPRVVTGTVEPARDFLFDHSSDFILKETAKDAADSVRTEVVLLYNGRHTLTPTHIRAASRFRPGPKNIFTGVKESIAWEGADSAALVIHHWEDSAGVQPVRYDKTWRWADTTWSTGMRATGLRPGMIKELGGPFTYLEKNGNTYTIPENCQSGGAIRFELVRSQVAALSDYYLIKTGIEDAGYNLVFQIDRRNTTFVLHKARGEKINGSNPLGDPEIRVDSTDTVIIITNDPVHKDIYWFTYSYSPDPLPYTIEPKKYRFVTCR